MNARPPCLVSLDEAQYQREADNDEDATKYWLEQAGDEIRRAIADPIRPRGWFDNAVPGKSPRVNWTLDEILVEAVNKDAQSRNLLCALMDSEEAWALRDAMADFWVKEHADAVAKHMQKAAQ